MYVFIEKSQTDPLKPILPGALVILINPLYTGGLFHCYMLDESICHLKLSGLFCGFYSIF